MTYNVKNHKSNLKIMENQTKFKWIPVSMQDVLFVEKLQNGKQRVHLGVLNKEHSVKECCGWLSTYYALVDPEVTHWLELPPLPTV